MMNRTLQSILLAASAGWMLLTSMPLWAQTQEARSSWNRWIKRPWEMRYFIYVEKERSWKYSQKLATESNQKSMKEDFSWEQFFEAQTVLRIPHWDLAKDPEYSKYPEDLSVVVIGFDKDGWVTTLHSFGKPLRGRLNSMSLAGYIVLSAGDGLADPTGSLGKWFIGFDEKTADGVTPALCAGNHDMPPMDPIQIKGYLYGRHYDVKDSWKTTPPFSCREWAWQLHETDRPYVDVTTYVPKGHPYTKSYPHASYILPFVGWGTFDRQKPVIGKHAETWYCLHECPSGDKPGPIADINAWAKANGWTSPKPPARMPVFNDNPKRRGYYPK